MFMRLLIKNLIALIFIFSFFSSCELFERRKEFKTYIIPAGKQSSVSTVSFLSGEELRFLAKFDLTAIYATKDTLNQYDLNKLYGFSDCGTPHHNNSARFGWRWFNNRLEIHTYCYSNGARYSQFMTLVELNQEYEYSIKLIGNQYLFTINGVSITMPRGCNGAGNKYRLFPYFGGDEAAPHDISIRIKEL